MNRIWAYPLLFIFVVAAVFLLFQIMIATGLVQLNHCPTDSDDAGRIYGTPADSVWTVTTDSEGNIQSKFDFLVSTTAPFTLNIPGYHSLTTLVGQVDADGSIHINLATIVDGPINPAFFNFPDTDEVEDSAMIVIVTCKL